MYQKIDNRRNLKNLDMKELEELEKKLLEVRELKKRYLAEKKYEHCARLRDEELELMEKLKTIKEGEG